MCKGILYKNEGFPIKSVCGQLMGAVAGVPKVGGIVMAGEVEVRRRTTMVDGQVASVSMPFA